MGGAKKKSPAQQEKSQTDESTKKSGEKRKGKKKEEGGSSKAEISVIVNEEQAMKIIKSAKVLTVQDLARQLGVKVSASNAFLKKLLNDGKVKRVGGFSGHHIYQPLSA
ncbi:MAG TPA: winged helix-turn-helix transcriptional regulator [Nitrosopumilaceae archaeon]|jgi:small subunit ribosomal protein S25e